jgi:hypothetical protein
MRLLRCGGLALAGSRRVDVGVARLLPRGCHAGR